ncbi:MAG TPA: IS200/IS605 family transposase [Capsulimonadaceae bacterium]|jgi:REP element-mobilizing transposase RayT
MSDNYIQLYYHLVWATKDRIPYIGDTTEAPLYQHIETLCNSARITVYALNGMPDHVHLVCTIPPTLALSDVIKDLKGKSAHYINHLDRNRLNLTWQPGYGALTLAKRNLKPVVEYVRNQKRHHADNTLSAQMEWASGLSSDVPEGHSVTP